MPSEVSWDTFGVEGGSLAGEDQTLVVIIAFNSIDVIKVSVSDSFEINMLALNNSLIDR